MFIVSLLRIDSPASDVLDRGMVAWDEDAGSEKGVVD